MCWYNFIKKITGDTSIKNATGLFKETPILKDLPSIVQQQILVGGASGALTYIYQKFLADYPPIEAGEDATEYYQLDDGQTEPEAIERPPLPANYRLASENFDFSCSRTNKWNI